MRLLNFVVFILFIFIKTHGHIVLPPCLAYDSKGMNTNERIIKLINAFQEDGYTVEAIIVEFNDKIGIRARSNTAINYDTKQPKKVYYLDGDFYQMGYLLGILAEPDVKQMCVDYIDKFVISFIKDDKTERSSLIAKILSEILISIVRKLKPEDIPPMITQEMNGILDGCKKINPFTKVTNDRLMTLNFGIDILLSLVFTGDFLIKKIPGLTHDELKIPIMCNGFSLFKKAANGNHYFGRDFMFHTADVFQNTACMIIYNPTASDSVLPLISLTAPGMVGSIAAMNINGVAAGVDVSRSGNCTPERIGINSITLLRYTIQNAGNVDNAVAIMQNTTRGVSWDYIIADGTNNKACIVEAGSSTSNPDFLAYPPDDLIKKGLLPTKEYIDAHQTVKLINGLMVRWNDYKYPVSYLNDFNKNLWDYYNKTYHTKKVLYPDAMAEKGYINKNYDEENCPNVFYFAPQRETRDDFVMVTNHFVLPEMRLYAMYPWTSMISAERSNDIQWRYDELNFEILNELEKGPVNYKTAKDLIDFLSPYGKFPDYYKNSPRSKDGKEIRIEGSVSICDLKNKTIESHYGYYCDGWIKLTLPKYIF